VIRYPSDGKRCVNTEAPHCALSLHVRCLETALQVFALSRLQALVEDGVQLGFINAATGIRRGCC
jgi:hypothetical protein